MTRSTRSTRSTRTTETPRWWRPVGLTAMTVAAGLTGTVLAIAPSSASPTWPAPDTGGGLGIINTNPATDAPCFTRPLHWSIALDGSLPTCSRPSGDDLLRP